MDGWVTQFLACHTDSLAAVANQNDIAHIFAVRNGTLPSVKRPVKRVDNLVGKFEDFFRRAAAILRRSETAIFRLVESEQIQATENAQGSLLICGNALSVLA